MPLANTVLVWRGSEGMAPRVSLHVKSFGESGNTGSPCITHMPEGGLPGAMRSAAGKEKGWKARRRVTHIPRACTREGGETKPKKDKDEAKKSPRGERHKGEGQGVMSLTQGCRGKEQEARVSWKSLE